MAKRATRGTASRTTRKSTRGNAGRTASRSNASGARRGRRPKSTEEYIAEDLGDTDLGYDDDDMSGDEFYHQLEQDVEQYDVEAPRVVSRARSRNDARIGNNFGAANRGRGQNQYTVNRGGRGSNAGRGGSSRSSQVRQLINNFANDLADLIGE